MAVGETTPPRGADGGARHAEILAAALAVLQERGYQKATMSAVASRARASKETLYNWYGDKRGLFAALIADNASQLKAALNATPADGHGAEARTTLIAFGRSFLELLLGDRAIALNRAAIADAPQDGTLAQLLAQQGRDAVFPKLRQVLERERTAGRLQIDDIEDAGETLLGLLLTDRQVRRLLGTLPAPDTAWINVRAETAADRFLTLFAPG